MLVIEGKKVVYLDMYVGFKVGRANQFVSH